MRYHFILARMAIIKKKTIRGFEDNEKKLYPHTLLVGLQNGIAFKETADNLKKLNTVII